METSKSTSVTLSLPDEFLRSADGPRFIQIEEPGSNYPGSSRSFRSSGTMKEMIVSRAKKWMMQSPCAIVTAWRHDDTREAKDTKNEKLMNVLRNKGYGVTKVRGCYAEVGQNASTENSYFVFITNRRPGLPLKDDVFDLAKKYNQYSFLYKEPGINSHAFLIGTNEDFGIAKEEDLGALKINEMSVENYATLDGGQISFG